MAAEETDEVKRNIKRFPHDFMFQLTRSEYTAIRSQFATLKGRGQHSKYRPYVFTEQGVAMLSSISIEKGGNMELNKAVQLIEAVANGTNPETGEAFPSSSPYNSPEIIRALFVCTQYIKHPPPKSRKTQEELQAENLSKGLPRNAGLPWTKELKAQLADSFKSGERPLDLAKKFERTKYAILLELKGQGLVTDEDVEKLK